MTGNDTELDPLAQRMPVAGTLTGQAVLSGKPIVANNFAGEVAETRVPSLKTESLLAVPLQVEGSAIGALNVANKAGGFTENDARILGLLADVAAIAIESARLRERAELLAIVEERQWLARELHDSVTQAMYSVTLYAEAARMALEAGKHDAAVENLRELQTMAREALFDIRLLIFELHPPILEGQGLAAALQIRLPRWKPARDCRPKCTWRGADACPSLWRKSCTASRSKLSIMWSDMPGHSA